MTAQICVQISVVSGEVPYISSCTHNKQQAGIKSICTEERGGGGGGKL